MRTAVAAALICIASTVAFAQPPRFDVASIRQSDPDSMGFRFSFPPGQLQIVNLRLRAIIAEAYDIGFSADRPDASRFKLVGGPNAILSRRFDVDAKTSADADQARRRAMLRTLLADRFRLRVHVETRRIPIYVLTVARPEFGPNFKRSDVNCHTMPPASAKTSDHETPRGCVNAVGGTYRARTLTYAGPVAQLVRLTQMYLDRPLVDATGLTGNFEWSTVFREPVSDTDAPTIFEAFQRDFGLRIDPRIGSYEVLVIDSVQLPTAR